MTATDHEESEDIVPSWCESTLLEDIAWGSLRAVLPLSTQIGAFDFFWPLRGRKMHFGKIWDTRPRSFLLICQNLNSIFRQRSVAT